uniref:Uncharacterized protein n=1 Tax=Cacopsylla melanoneura TaxID=428564 RepID=A0A8D8VYB9_9HEMI
MEVDTAAGEHSTTNKPTQRAPYRRRASIRIQTITEEINEPNEAESQENVDHSSEPTKRRCSLRPRKNSSSDASRVQMSKKGKDSSTATSDSLVISSSISKIKSRHSTLETIFEEPLENGIRIFSKTKSKRSLILNGNITKMKLKTRKTKVKKMNLQRTIKRLKNKITFDELQKKLNHLGI